MVLNFPIEAFIEAQKEKNRNWQLAMQQFGQGIQGLGEGIGSGIQTYKQKNLIANLIRQIQTQRPVQGPQLPGVGMVQGMPSPTSGMGSPAPTPDILGPLMQLYPEAAGPVFSEMLSPLKRAQAEYYQRKARGGLGENLYQDPSGTFSRTSSLGATAVPFSSAEAAGKALATQASRQATREQSEKRRRTAVASKEAGMKQSFQKQKETSQEALEAVDSMIKDYAEAAKANEIGPYMGPARGLTSLLTGGRTAPKRFQYRKSRILNTAVIQRARGVTRFGTQEFNQILKSLPTGNEDPSLGLKLLLSLRGEIASGLQQRQSELNSNLAILNAMTQGESIPLEGFEPAVEEPSVEEP